MSVAESELRHNELVNAEIVTVVEPSRGWLSLNLRELWAYRELLYFFIWRDVKVRYKQTVIGALWAILQPLMTMVVFTIIFDNFVNISSDGLPYPIFIFAALIPWNYFASSLNGSVGSVVANANLITKVYFPRLLLPFSATISGLVDSGIAFVFLLAMMFWFGITPDLNVVVLPLFVLLAMLTALSIGLWLAALNVRYRDVGKAIPFLIQLWMFASPVVYSVNVVPEKWRLLYALNPMVGVIDGFRWALLGNSAPAFGAIVTSTIIILLLCVSGLLFFRRMERIMADVI